jgi:hypothetical protein
VTPTPGFQGFEDAMHSFIALYSFYLQHQVFIALTYLEVVVSVKTLTSFAQIQYPAPFPFFITETFPGPEILSSYIAFGRASY